MLLVLGDQDLDKTEYIKDKIEKNFDLSPKGIRELLGLNKPIYEVTSAYGHFGRKSNDKGQFTWEKTDKSDIFKK
jgi:S-adenosylmethionine synthetase